MKTLLLTLMLVGSLVSHAEPQHCLVTARTLAALAAQTVAVPDDVEIEAVQHTEPPKGWNCGNGSKTDKDHRCECHRTCAWNPDTRQVEEKEDPKCRSWCFRDHCACLSECDS